MIDLAYNRALHTDDYPALLPWSRMVLDFEHEMRSKGIPYRKDHEHRTWEYANVLKQLETLLVGRLKSDVHVLDTGAGGSSLAPLLAVMGYRVTITDSMAYGDIREAFTEPQRRMLNLETNMPVIDEPVEMMASVDSESMDVAMCISVIEHVAEDQFLPALRELRRVTKPGGYLFLTSDYFENAEQHTASPYRQIQHTAFTEQLVHEIPALLGVEFVGGADLRYRGDFVHNYSFVNMVFQKPV